MSAKRKGRGKSTAGSKKWKAELMNDCPVVCMNASYSSVDFKELFSKFWNGEVEDLQDSPATAFKEPFKCCQLKNFISDHEFLDSLKDELLDLDFVEKNNDLYKFHQTTDLGKMQTPHIQGLKKLLFNTMVDWLKEVTSIPLDNTVDMGCSRYEFTDTLLCHDDELEGRRMAFVLYLVPPWQPEDGGLLDLFDRDEHGQPRRVVRSLLPTSGCLVLFEVTADSFHQVSELLTSDKVRLSVNGWFHGPAAPRPPPYIEPRPQAEPPGHVQEEMVYSWINPLYLAEETQSSIRQQFEGDSEIQLEGFLLPDKYAAVSAALRQISEWELVGPANRRRVERCAPANLPPPLAECVTLLCSEAVFLILSQLTGLVLHPLAVTSHGERVNGGAGGSQDSDSEDDGKDGSTAACRAQVRRWRPGAYTLVHDDDSAQRECALDVRLCVQADGWQDKLGGFTSYIARGEDTELLSVSPESNALSLVYRDRETVGFVKHINAQARDRQPFYDIACTYYE
ncbi:prolyl 3-hydroxylase OGFOD1-like [Pollicipes pollicipes]|uniref:prolyl 3-hydroxylase OGFOD1-like n=1 Tax=Pollicipes pollicipes TaxID=41117 RepID=UPI001884DDCB|nr:prolyl 3-hydroxylase OGFOD1-like [Pollicipes pollicipes]XP_037078381.1 prolyl 3-hydroxylase OGFOD1-like [Pollicipes pollicipes]XP_037078382.1 prolyl 3-hydroxylase OGFOD1-like [Pollicipes pollicipes]XP_037078383.1 prolyl 3-hydroxylase OGFOD1-like [Pollicipes pollicipes]XP_037078384.1 prolyl 3-hydroxylase OGFOD1-like [Pollicipes pollicipes]XP_037078385.1 prolyl 3-hydroxylase OGFOD1-like [Pollicipes pollicipes]